jgi:hypothetical protein
MSNWINHDFEEMDNSGELTCLQLFEQPMRVLSFVRHGLSPQR